jgi:hypothetical protein
LRQTVRCGARRLSQSGSRGLIRFVREYVTKAFMYVCGITCRLYVYGMYTVSGDTGKFTGFSMLQSGRVHEGTCEVESEYVVHIIYTSKMLLATYSRN